MEYSHFILFAALICIFIVRGFFSTDAFISLSFTAFHIPLTIDVFQNLVPYVRLSETAQNAAILGTLSFIIAFSFAGIARDFFIPRRLERSVAVSRRRLGRMLIGVGALTFVVSSHKMMVTLQSGYAYSLSATLFQPTIDWLVLSTYLVLVAIAVTQITGRPYRILFYLLPFAPLLFSGSRQIILGPLLSFILISYATNFKFRPIIFARMLAVLFVLSFAMFEVIEFVRNARISETENVQWSGINGIAGVVVEMGRSARLIDWSLGSCAGDVSFTGYLMEAVSRIIPGYSTGMQNLSISVAGGGNGFSAVAEGICIGGHTGYAFWTALIGFLLGIIYSGNYRKNTDAAFRLRAFIFMSIAVIWPRDELIGYVREIVWVSLLLPVLLGWLLGNRARQRSTPFLANGHTRRLRQGESTLQL